uniref:H(+)-exporting diphosphatase n=1 Tax=Heterorhabditis bacteriophora TaxID=37862 RepID=A0A1I7WID7_HETBA
MAQYYGGVSGLVDSVWSCIYPVISSIGGLIYGIEVHSYIIIHKSYDVMPSMYVFIRNIPDAEEKRGEWSDHPRPLGTRDTFLTSFPQLLYTRILLCFSL